MQQATRAIKRELPRMLVIGDVCLCEYTSHGHCGVVRKLKLAGPLSSAAQHATAVAIHHPEEKDEGD